MPWIRLSVAVPGAGAEAAGEALEALGAVAVTWLDGGDAAILEPAPGAAPHLVAWPEARAVGLFPLEADLGAVRRRFAGRPLRVDFLADADWTLHWRRHVEPRRFGALTVAPSHSADGVAGTVLSIDPGGAFGTGSHPTTRLCLAWLASLPLAGRSVLDFGCGSGILAIAARLLGAGSVTAVDHDPQALAVARRNGAGNGVALTVTASEDFEPGRPFDLVVANVLAGPLVAEAPRLRESLAPGGRLALCGLLPAQVPEVAAAYPEVCFDATRVMDGWALLAGWRVVRPELV